MGLDLCHGQQPEGIIGARPEIVRQSDLHQPAKVQRLRRNDAARLSGFGKLVTDCFLSASL